MKRKKNFKPTKLGTWVPLCHFSSLKHPFPALLRLRRPAGGGMLLVDGDLALSSSGGASASAASRTVRRLFTLRSSWSWALAPVSLILRRPVRFFREAPGGSSWRRSWRAPGSATRPTGWRPRRRGGSRQGRKGRRGTSTCSSGSTPRWIRRASRCVELRCRGSIK